MTATTATADADATAATAATAATTADPFNATTRCLSLSRLIFIVAAMLDVHTYIRCLIFILTRHDA
jgi:hypothetical protein